MHWRHDREPAVIAERTVRHRDPAHRSQELLPFPAYLTPLPELAPAPLSTRERPRFAGSGGLRHCHIAIEPGTSLYATGEAAGPLRRNGRVTVCWNTDNFDYTDQSRSLYQSHPFVLAVRRDGTAYGVICETTYWCRIDLRDGILFSARGPSPAVTVIQRDSPQEVVQALAELTGFMPMPPRWALGYQQCRWSYEPASRVLEVARGFRERRIPCDVIWLDIDYMDGFRCFTFDHAKFPDPPGLNRQLHAMGFRNVSMIDPGIKVDRGYFVYDQAHASGGFVRGADGREHHGSVWPGPCAFPDFTRADVRTWWAGLYAPFLATGIDGVWNDMNEPAIFDGPGKSMPGDCVHDADEELGGPASHERYHNIYGMQMVRATREGMEAAREGERIFVLTRSNFLGGQRYAATWTGDNRSNWKHLKWSIPMVVNLGLSCQPFAGPDIGGFVGDATPELFARFMGLGSLLPFARAHSIKGSRDHEPWSFGEECEATCRRALERRYRLIPYLYTVFEEAARTGLPIARPVWFADPADARLRGVEDAFLLGGDVLVQACVDEHGSVQGDPVLRGWAEFHLEDARDRSLPRLFLRPGAVLPVAAGGAMHTGEIDMTSLTLLVSPGDELSAEGTLYHDDGHSHAYQSGAYLRLEMYWNARDGVRVMTLHGGYDAPVGFAGAVVLAPQGADTRTEVPFRRE